MSDAGRSVGDEGGSTMLQEQGTMLQEQGGAGSSADIEEGWPREVELKLFEEKPVELKWFEEKLAVDDTLAEQGEASLDKIFGLVEGPTIFKHDRKADDEEHLKLRVVAIGPYHRNYSPPLKFNDDYKWKITRFMANKLRIDVTKYLSMMERKEKNHRRCYNEDLSEWSSREFQTMLLLDSSFILFVMDASRNSLLDLGSKFMDSIDLLLDRNTFIEYMALSLDVMEHLKQIKLDLLTVDNQIPFSAIKLLLNCFGEGHELSIENLALSCFNDLWPMRNEEQKINTELPQFLHLLHLFHWSRIPVEGYEINVGILINENASSQLYIPSATELQKSATNFTNNVSGSGLAITFRRRLMSISAVINIPVLHLYDYSKSMFCNLIAFEANPTNDVLCFMAYSACMSCLLQREGDVKLLMERGILASTNYKDTEVIEFFKDLNRKVEDSIMPDTLIELFEFVFEHHSRPTTRWYRNFPWIKVALAGSYLLYLLTLVQAVYSVLSYHVPDDQFSGYENTIITALHVLRAWNGVSFIAGTIRVD